jgi:glycosyltransferase involved in cell wall biosynthesis
MKISIIIPVYNVRDYIVECLESILNLDSFDIQYEIICVDDCSPDNSVQLIKKLVKKKKIENLSIIHHKVNKGLGAARNTGIQFAQFEYIWFIDSDDAIDAIAFNNIISSVREDFDVLMFGVTMCDAQLKKDKEYLKYTNKNIENYSNSFKNKLERQLDVVAWNKLVKTSLFFEHEHLRFTESVLNEDEIFSLYLCKIANNVILSDQQVYQYRIREESITTSIIKDSFFDSWEVNFRDAYNFFIDYPSEFWVNWFLEKLQVFNRKYHFNDNQKERLKLLVSVYYSLLPERIWAMNWRYNEELVDFFKDWYSIYKVSVKTNPLVSVIVPTYKRPDNLIVAIESLLEQSYKKIEIIVVNDTGHDTSYTEEYQTKLAPFLDKITYIELPVNIGGAAARNVGIEKAKGKYVSFLDDDDKYLKDRITNGVKVLNQYQSKDVWGCYCSYENRESKSKNLSFPSGNLTYDILNLNYSEFSLNTDTVLIKKQFLTKHNIRFDSKLRRHQDLDLFLKLFKNGIVIGYESIDVLIRPEETLIGNWLNNEIMHATKRRFLDTHKEIVEKFQIPIQKQLYKTQWDNVVHYYQSPNKLEKFENFVTVSNFKDVDFHEYEYLLGVKNEQQYQSSAEQDEGHLLKESQEKETILKKKLQKELESIKISSKKQNIDIKSLKETLDDLESQKEWYETTYESLPIWWKKFGSALRKVKKNEK